MSGGNAWNTRDKETRTWADRFGRSGDQHKTDLNRCIGRLVEAKLCAGQARFWLRPVDATDRDYQKIKESGVGTSRLELVTLSKSADGKTADHAAILLKETTHLQDGAALGIRVLVDKRSGALLEYTVRLEGTVKSTGEPWFAHADLTIHPEGEGACGHSLIHCHVGSNPNHDFQTRVPLPRLSPAEALEWLLATVHPALDPAPALADGTAT